MAVQPERHSHDTLAEIERLDRLDVRTTERRG